MKLIVGLGNVGPKYDWTRHNVGFEVIDNYLKKHNLILNEKKFNGLFVKTKILNQDVIIAKPYTYMNLSGHFILQLMNYFRITLNELLVIQDDINLDIGKIRIKNNSSAGGHNGIKDIINMLGSDKFYRIKIGVGKPNTDLVNYVLGKFSPNEKAMIINKFNDINSIIDFFISDQILLAANKYN